MRGPSALPLRPALRPYSWPAPVRWAVVGVGLGVCTGLDFLLAFQSRPFLVFFPFLSAVLLLLRWREGVAATLYAASIGAVLDASTGTDPLPVAVVGAGITVASGGSIAFALHRVRTLLGEKDRLLARERTARADAEEALCWVQEAEAVRAEFISQAAHALKTPITVMSGYAQLLLADPVVLPSSQRYPYTDGVRDTDGVREALEAIVRQGATLDTLYQQLLDVAAGGPQAPPGGRTALAGSTNPWAAPASLRSSQRGTEPDEA